MRVLHIDLPPGDPRAVESVIVDDQPRGSRMSMPGAPPSPHGTRPLSGLPMVC